MEDLKQIQEFFSKSLEEMMSLDDQAKAYYLAKVKSGEIDTLPEDPKASFLAQMTKDQMAHDKETLRRERGLEEGKQLDIVDFAKVVQAVTKTGHPVTVLLTPKFNEIEIITGMNAPDDMLFDLSNAVDSLGYDIIIAADSSNLSRREYSQIRRVNGGHKDYFEESVNEVEEDPIDTITMDVPLFIRVLEYAREDAQADMDLHDLAEKAIAATKQQGLLQMDDYDMLVGDLEQIAMEEEEGYSKFLKDDPEHPGGKTKGLTPDVMNKILMNVIKDLDETTDYMKRRRAMDDYAVSKKDKPAKSYNPNPSGKTDYQKRREKDLEERIAEALNKINEELCPKGKAYIKKRMAAGEKSSAYLSGRAVKVCKGQMKG